MGVIKKEQFGTNCSRTVLHHVLRSVGQLSGTFLVINKFKLKKQLTFSPSKIYRTREITKPESLK
jgi:hypothetical protein